MFLKFKYSLLHAYTTSLKTNYKHIFFYLAWYAIYFVAAAFVSILFLIYTDVLNYSAMMQNYDWILNSLQHQLRSFFWGTSYKDLNFNEFSFYGFLQLFLSEDIINPAFKTMSFKEYFNIVLIPHKTALAVLSMVWLTLNMTVSIGYIKTTLKFQTGKKAKLEDMYQYLFLLPQYCLGKLILFLSCLAPLTFLSITTILILGAASPDQNMQLAKFGLVLFIIFLLLCMFILFLYQRLRFIKYFIIDKKVSAFKAARLSWNLTQGSVISLLLFSVVSLTITTISPISGLCIMLSRWLNKQAETNVYLQMLENKK